MSLYFPQDYGHSAHYLEQKYDKTGRHPCPLYSPWYWAQVVAQRSTLLGYWDWVVTKLEEEREELERDSPYNPT